MTARKPADPAAAIKRGFEFTHKSKMDLSWKPEPGQTWKHDAPKARMVVTRTTREGTVWYGYKPADGEPAKGGWAMGLDKFIETYGGQA